MSLRGVTYLILLAVVLCCLSGCNQSGLPNTPVVTSLPAKPMNLILVSLDTLRSDRLGCYGYPLSTSPFLDELSRHSLTVPDVLAQNPSTILSHRAIFTGLYVFQQTPGAPPAERTLAGQLAAKGYSTAAFTDGGLMNAQYGNNPGFQIYNDQAGGMKHIVNRGLNWLDTLDDEPFFLFLHTYDIHYPYTPPEPFADLFLPGDESPYHLGSDHGQEHWNNLDLRREEFIWISRRYDGGIRSTDTQMKRLWAALSNHGILENTVVVVVSDHGESLGEHRYVGHRQLYDVQLQVPLIISHPTQKRPFILDGAAETIDIFPTLLDILGLNSDLTFSGRSMMPAITARTGWSLLRPRLSETWAKTFRTGPDWKIILRESTGEDELYWLSTDPEEDRNVAKNYPDRMNQLRTGLMEFTGLSVGDVRKGPEQRQVPVMLMMQDDSGKENELMNQLRELGYLQ